MDKDTSLELIRVVMSNRKAYAEQRQRLLEMAKYYGIAFEPTTCVSCWLDLAMTIRQKILKEK